MPIPVAQRRVLPPDEAVHAPPSVAAHTSPWQGPCSDGPQGGISQSLISKWLACRERFRILTVEGLRAVEQFSAPLEYGNMWHAMEEKHANRSSDHWELTDSDWVASLQRHCQGLMQRYPFQQEAVNHWYTMALAQFPRYVQWWQRHPDMDKREPLLSERVFRVPYRLPSGRRIAYLRGKWDSVDLVTGGENAGIWLQENKSKSSINGAKIAKQLTFDLQTMLYLIALQSFQHDQATDTPGDANDPWGERVRGVRYNVVRRSAHKSAESMLKKLEEDVSEGRGREWFERWNVEITNSDVTAFKTQCLDPVLENVCDDWEWWSFCHEAKLSPFDSDRTHMTRECEFPGHVPRHYRLPYGVYSPVAEGGIGEVDNWMATGSEAGLTHVTDLFPELQETTR